MVPVIEQREAVLESEARDEGEHVGGGDSVCPFAGTVRVLVGDNGAEAVVGVEVLAINLAKLVAHLEDGGRLVSAEFRDRDGLIEGDQASEDHLLDFKGKLDQRIL